MSKSIFLVGTVAAVLAATCCAWGQSTFVDVASSKGLGGLSGQYLHGGAWGDVNGDGYPDLISGAFGSAEGNNRLWINNSGTGFTESVQASINVSNGRTSGGAIADFNNDGWKDIIVMNNRRSTAGKDGLNQLLYNTGSGVFVDATAGSNINQTNMSGRNCFTLDYDGDGLLDVILQNDMWGVSTYKKSKLMRNNGNMTFTDMTGAAGLPTADRNLVGLGGAVGDINGDGWPDFINIGSDSSYNPQVRLWINNHNGTFTQATNYNFDATFPWYGNTEDWPCGAAIGDLDGD